MTTKFLDNKIALSKSYCRGVAHEKQRFGRSSCLPPRCPQPLKKRKFYFYCHLAVSDEAGQRLESSATWDAAKKKGHKKGAQRDFEGHTPVEKHCEINSANVTSCN